LQPCRRLQASPAARYRGVVKRKPRAKADELTAHLESSVATRPEEVAEARGILHAAAPDAARTLVNIMLAGDKEDLVKRQAANDILAINGITAKKESGDSSAKVVGGAIIAALLGMAKVTGLGGAEKSLSRLMKNVTPVDDLLPEELQEQDALT
jgi:hypothetical protein